MRRFHKTDKKQNEPDLRSNIQTFEKLELRSNKRI